MVAQSGLVAKAVLVVLFLSSVVSWAIIGQKYIELRRLRQESARFLKLLRSGAGTAELCKAARSSDGGLLGSLFAFGYELVHGRGQRWSGDRDDFWKRLDGEITEHVGAMEKHLSFLATVGNVSPFIGLLGTVWGIMDAFRDIGQQGSASLAVVAPGIAEALVTTAAGLAAAIPAVVAYNYFLNQIDAAERQAERVAAEIAPVLLDGGKG
jgi:biopolymer transport protein TolQ